MKITVTDERKISYLWLEKEALEKIHQTYFQNPKLKPAKPYVLATYLIIADSTENKVSRSLKALAKKVGCERNTLVKCLRILEDLSLLKREQRHFELKTKENDQEWIRENIRA